MAGAVQAYARRAKDGSLMADATELRRRAERKVGQILKWERMGNVERVAVTKVQELCFPETIR
jgi:hypothetical protein